MDLLYSEKALFLKYWYIPGELYNVSALPGWKEDTKSVLSLATNIGINRYITDTQKQAAIKAFKFLTSYEVQKNYIASNFLFSAINSLYDDPDVCIILNCNFLKEIQPFNAIEYKTDELGNDQYIAKYQQSFFEYLYQDKSIEQAIKDVDDMTRIYYFTTDTEDTKTGLVFFILYIVFTVLIVFSMVFLFIEKFKYNLRYLTIDLWIITFIGILLLMSGVLTMYGNATIFKCHIRIVILTFGFLLSILPSIYKLVIYIPIKNNFTVWAEKNKYIFILIVVAFNGILNGLWSFTYCRIERENINEGEKFEICKMNGTFGTIIYYSIFIFCALIVLITLLLIFMEWNLKKSYYDVRFLMAAVMMNILLLIIFNITIKIKVKDYVEYSVIYAANFLTFSISNYIFLYLIRIIKTFVKPNEDEMNRSFIRKSVINTDNKLSVISTVSSNSNSKTSKTSEISNKLLQCHYME